MNELKDLTDLLSQYDWREVIEVGIGTAIGTGHAIYDKIKGKKKWSSTSLAGFTGVLTAAFDPIQPIDSFYRNIGNGLLGGASYIVSYDIASRTLSAFSDNRQLQNLE